MRSSSASKRHMRSSPTRRDAASLIRSIRCSWSLKTICPRRLSSRLAWVHMRSIGRRLTVICGLRITRTWTSSRRLRTRLNFTLGSQKLNPYLASGTLIRPRRRLKGFMTFGTTSIAGEVSSGWTRRLTKVAIGMLVCLCPSELGIGADPHTSLSVAMTNDIPRRRTNPNVHGGKKKIPLKSDRWSIFA